ncbi:MAG: FHA domain-containing protein [Gammaproteobacteria bacterium]|nr:FHA domain-containing protein [Gammaproteobacteria bacterium]MDE1887108.1 FHA domain-containing protein [Gammaproteobacteria bacterium]MDE2024147.1 FHA domain-containing protein [Gammaproteobacteria bacterium]MDE2274163.1 FHA domain-containing protein [Gammaproteobacteria bacterium]
MGKLTLTLDGQELAQYELEKERYTLGRLPDNDVHMDNMAVSGHHALIINILKDSFLEDLNSTNGTYVNGKLIKKHALQPGDVITIGRFQLKYQNTRAKAVTDDFERTMVINPGTASAPGAPSLEHVKRAVAQSKAEEPRAVAPAKVTPSKAAPPKGSLQVLSGEFAGKELDLNKPLTTLGRPGVQVVAITRRTDGFYVVNVHSGTGQGFPTVNGEQFGARARKLADNDVIELAGVKMGFYTEPSA